MLRAAKLLPELRQRLHDLVRGLVPARVAPQDVTWHLVGQQPVPASASAGPRAVSDGKAEPRRNYLIGLRHPRTRPDQFTGQGKQTPTIIQIQSLQQRITATIEGVSPATAGTATRSGRPGPQRDKHAVDVDKDQRPYGVGAHSRAVPAWQHPRTPTCANDVMLHSAWSAAAERRSPAPTRAMCTWARSPISGRPGPLGRDPATLGVTSMR